jgi:hypothetical protein
VTSDDGRIAEINNLLNEIENSQAVEQERRTLETQFGTKIGDPQPSVQGSSIDVNEIRDYLTGKVSPTSKVAVGAK